MFKRQHHNHVLAILKAFDAPRLEIEFKAFFGGGTLIALDHSEFRLSKDIDFLCSSKEGYRKLRAALIEKGAEALFGANASVIKIPGDIRADQYGVRFPVQYGQRPAERIKVEIIHEARIEFGAPTKPSWSPVACLNDVDRQAEKLLCNTDRGADRSTFGKDLIDLCVLAKERGLLCEAVKKAEDAYPVMGSLKREMEYFSRNPSFRRSCYQQHEIDDPSIVADGFDILAKCLDLPNLDRIYSEISDLDSDFRLPHQDLDP